MLASSEIQGRSICTRQSPQEPQGTQRAKSLLTVDAFVDGGASWIEWKTQY